jgi:hypothetical protein
MSPEPFSQNARGGLRNLISLRKRPGSPFCTWSAIAGCLRAQGKAYGQRLSDPGEKETLLNLRKRRSLKNKKIDKGDLFI